MRLSEAQIQAVLEGTASWFQSDSLVAVSNHVRSCSVCGPPSRGKYGPQYSTKDMCDTGRRIAVGLSVSVS
jgi:hypothetical protein